MYETYIWRSIKNQFKNKTNFFPQSSYFHTKVPVEETWTVSWQNTILGTVSFQYNPTFLTPHLRSHYLSTLEVICDLS